MESSTTSSPLKTITDNLVSTKASIRLRFATPAAVGVNLCNRGRMVVQQHTKEKVPLSTGGLCPSPLTARSMVEAQQAAVGASHRPSGLWYESQNTSDSGLTRNSWEGIWSKKKSYLLNIS